MQQLYWIVYEKKDVLQKTQLREWKYMHLDFVYGAKYAGENQSGSLINKEDFLDW